MCSVQRALLPLKLSPPLPINRTIIETMADGKRQAANRKIVILYILLHTVGTLSQVAPFAARNPAQSNAHHAVCPCGSPFFFLRPRHRRVRNRSRRGAAESALVARVLFPSNPIARSTPPAGGSSANYLRGQKEKTRRVRFRPRLAILCPRKDQLTTTRIPNGKTSS